MPLRMDLKKIPSAIHFRPNISVPDQVEEPEVSISVRQGADSEHRRPRSRGRRGRQSTDRQMSGWSEVL